MAEPDDELQRAFRDLPYRLKREIAAAVKEEAEDLAEEIRDAAPEGETGNLKRSVRVRRGRGSLEFVVSAGGDLTTKPVRAGVTASSYDYALGREFGTQHQPAEPFFFNTARARAGEINDRLAERVQEILDGD